MCTLQHYFLSLHIGTHVHLGLRIPLLNYIVEFLCVLCIDELYYRLLIEVKCDHQSESLQEELNLFRGI